MYTIDRIIKNIKKFNYFLKYFIMEILVSGNENNKIKNFRITEITNNNIIQNIELYLEKITTNTKYLTTKN
jgi:hypothetical protein